jgi:hypothetical protein
MFQFGNAPALARWVKRRVDSSGACSVRSLPEKLAIRWQLSQKHNEHAIAAPTPRRRGFDKSRLPAGRRRRRQWTRTYCVCIPETGITCADFSMSAQAITLIDLGVELIDNRLQRPAGAMRLSQMVDS